jgi:hypothetical protein
MSRLTIVLLLIAYSVPVCAGGNPHARIYIDFDPPDRVHEIAPAPYTTVTAYVCLDSLGGSFQGVCMRMADPVEACPEVIVTSYWSLDLYHSHISFPAPWDSPEGAYVESDYCVTDGAVIAGHVEMFYLGGACCLEILDHADYPRWVVDCGDPPGVDYYCVLAHGSIGGAECPEGDCGSTPVRDNTWGAMKALYR